MPKVSEFYGIVIAMYYDEKAKHKSPHFHAKYSGKEASFEISSGRVLAGNLPARALSMVEEWTVQHRKELNSNWENAVAGKPIAKISPLK